MSAPEVLIFTKPYCPYCIAAKALLHEKGVGFREIDVSASAADRDEMVRRSGRSTVPQVFIGAQHIGGYDDLSALERTGQLDPLLGIGT